MSANLLKPTPVRFHEETSAKLKMTSRRFRLKPAELIRRAVDQKLDEWEAQGTLTIRAN